MRERSTWLSRGPVALVGVAVLVAATGCAKERIVTSPSTTTTGDLPGWVDEPDDPEDDPPESVTSEPEVVWDDDSWVAEADAACAQGWADRERYPDPGTDDFDDVMALAEAEVASGVGRSVDYLTQVEVPESVLDDLQGLVDLLEDHVALTLQIANAYSEGYFSLPMELDAERAPLADEIAGLASALGLDACALLMER